MPGAEPLAQRPDVANALRQIRADVAEADRAHLEHKDSTGYTREQFFGRAPSASMMASLGAHGFQF